MNDMDIFFCEEELRKNENENRKKSNNMEKMKKNEKIVYQQTVLSKLTEKLLDKEIELLELDNFMQQELETQDSLFDSDDYIYNNSYAFTMYMNVYCDENDFINIEWKTLDDEITDDINKKVLITGINWI